MKLHARTTQPEDLDQCLSSVRDRFLYSEEQLQQLRALWFMLLSRDLGRSSVVFDESEPRRILAFGVSAPLKQLRFDRILAERAPFIARTLLEEWISDSRPFLDEHEAATANAALGLSVFALHNGISSVVDVRDVPNMLSKLSEAFIGQHAGCQLKVIAHEPFGLPQEFAIDLGLQVIDYAPEFDSILADVPADRKPSIVIMTREHAQEHPGNLALNALFLRFTPPRFSLNAIERRLLRFAIEGESDPRIADILQIAPRTLKKRWAEIYLAMEAATGVMRGELNGHRGAEARRHVLHYVRQHPEELHAYGQVQAEREAPAVARV